MNICPKVDSPPRLLAYYPVVFKHDTPLLLCISKCWGYIRPQLRLFRRTGVPESSLQSGYFTVKHCSLEHSTWTQNYSWRTDSRHVMGTRHRYLPPVLTIFLWILISTEWTFAQWVTLTTYNCGALEWYLFPFYPIPCSSLCTYSPCNVSELLWMLHFRSLLLLNDLIWNPVYIIYLFIYLFIY